jgi:ribosomal-protein-alanine N-acetyltransferase
MGSRPRPRPHAAMTDARSHATPAMPPANVTVRLARREDVEDVASIERGAFSDPWSVGTFRSLASNPLVHFAVAEDAITGKLFGYVVVWYVIDEAEIANLAVSPDARRQGIGARLLDYALDIARERQCRVVFLEVRESNIAARSLYDSRGFTVAGRRPKYYRKPVEDALVLRCRL